MTGGAMLPWPPQEFPYAYIELILIYRPMSGMDVNTRYPTISNPATPKMFLALIKVFFTNLTPPVNNRCRFGQKGDLLICR